jgi:hypothetical protein
MNWTPCMCIVPHCAVTVGSQCDWYLLSRMPKHKSITVIDTYNTILLVGTQIDTRPEVILNTAVIAWGKITLLRWLISKMYFSHWKPPGVSERMWSVNLDASISGEYQTLGGHSCRRSE